MERERLEVPGEEQEQQQAQARPARAPSLGSVDGVRALAAMGVGNVQLTRMVAASRPLIQRDPNKKAKDAPTWEEAEKTIEAIVQIVNEFHEVKDGMAIRRTHPQDHPDVPERYRPLLQDWFYITHGTVDTGGGAKVVYRGKDLSTRIDGALANTKPVLDAIAAGGDERHAQWLKENFHATVAKFRARAVKEEVSDTIDAEARKAGAGSGFTVMTEDEALKVASGKALETVRLAATMVTRFTNGAAVDAAKKLDDAFKEAAKNATGPPGIETVKKAANAQLALMQLKGFLDGVNAIVAIADPARREQLIKERTDLFGTIHSTVNVIQVLGQFVSGATAIASAATYGLAIAKGNARLAAQIATKAAPALDRINVALNVIGVVHGTLVLLDDEATSKQKEAAILEVGVSGAGVGSFVLRLFGVSGVGGPATLAVVITYFGFKGILEKGAEMITNMIKLGLTICFQDMARTGREMFDTAVRFATALDLAAKESDPAKKAEYLKQIDGLRWNLKNFYLKDFLNRATRTTGNDNKDPGAYPALRKRFAPLKERPLETDENLIDTAGLVIKTMVEVMSKPEVILEEAVKDAVERRASHDLPQPPEDPSKPGSAEPATAMA